MTKTLYALFETDPVQEQKGIGLKFGPATFFAKRAGGANREFDRIFEEKTRSMSSRAQMAALSNEESDKILKEVYAESVVTGWEGVTDRKGKPLEFNKANFIQVMTDLPELWRGLRQAAASHENFLLIQAKAEGEELGNS